MTKSIFITGAGTGLGKGTAIGLAKAGHRVIASVEIISQVTSLREAAESEGVELEVLKLDINCSRDRELISKYDFDIFVANAAIGEGGPISEIPVERLKRIFETNVFNTLETTQIAARKFVEQHAGKIVFVSSIAGLTVSPYLGPYCSSKHALEGIAQAMYQELEPLGVQVATINPGPFKTGFNDRMMEEAWKWYDPAKNFTPREEFEKGVKVFEKQFDPEEMIAKMVEIIPAEAHKFRTVYPESSEEQSKTYEKEMWVKSLKDNQ